MCASNFQHSEDKLFESQKIKDAINFLQSGQFVLAEKILTEVISSNPNSDEALHLQGLVLSQQNRLEESYDLISRAIAISPKNSLYYGNRGEIVRQMGKPKLAIEDLNLAISMDPKNPSLFLNRAVAYHHLKDYTIAIDNYQTAIGLGLKNDQIYFYLGNIYAELGDYSKAAEFYQASLKINPQNAMSWTNLGAMNDKRKKFEEAVECYLKSIALNPEDAVTYANLGKTYCELGQNSECIKVCTMAIELNPLLAAAYSNLADAWTNLKNYARAIPCYQRAVELDPGYYQAHFNCGGALLAAQDYDQAILALSTAIKINPLSADAFYNRSVAKLKNKDVRSSLEDSEVVLKLKPNMDFVIGALMGGYLSLCEWDKFEEFRKIIPAKIKNFERVAHPMQVMLVFDSLEYLKTSATLLIKQRYDIAKDIFKSDTMRHKKIRIGYFSEDFKQHPVGYLLAEVLELHDRGQFEIYAFSFSKEPPDALTKRISQGVDHFYDVGAKTSDEIVALARSLNLDIAIDLGIFTAEQFLVFKHRVAPVQANYLGYAGTSGTQYIDYIIADDFTIPESAENYYTEKIVRLPCFMPRDTKVKPAAKKFTRTECGLPEKGFIFCCTSGYGKILPETFAAWMKILKQVPGSCLWLGESKDSGVMDKVRSHAERLGVKAERLIFAKRLDSPADYLARLQLADLFLDTFPYGAHTLSNDALWAGVPVLTRAGETFASRVAGSFLTQLQLPELITTSMEDYETRAVNLGNHPDQAKQLKQKLMENSVKSQIFNSSYYARKLEESFKAMCHLGLNVHENKNISIRP
jgi:predicted O-linked N-acetylglucosamine transferase (SPINDLY family)